MIRNKTSPKHTSEEVVLQTSTGHTFINQQSLVIFNTETNQFDQIRMDEVTKNV